MATFCQILGEIVTYIKLTLKAIGVTGEAACIIRDDGLILAV